MTSDIELLENFLSEVYSCRAMMRIVSGDIVNVIGKAEDIELETITVDSQNNLIIVHPDILLSGTSLSNAVACNRRAILSERFKVGQTVLLFTRNSTNHSIKLVIDWYLPGLWSRYILPPTPNSDSRHFKYTDYDS